MCQENVGLQMIQAIAYSYVNSMKLMLFANADDHRQSLLLAI